MQALIHKPYHNLDTFWLIVNQCCDEFVCGEKDWKKLHNFFHILNMNILFPLKELQLQLVLCLMIQKSFSLNDHHWWKRCRKCNLQWRKKLTLIETIILSRMDLNLEAEMTMLLPSSLIRLMLELFLFLFLLHHSSWIHSLQEEMKKTVMIHSTIAVGNLKQQHLNFYSLSLVGSLSFYCWSRVLMKKKKLASCRQLDLI